MAEAAEKIGTPGQVAAAIAIGTRMAPLVPAVEPAGDHRPGPVPAP